MNRTMVAALVAALVWVSARPSLWATALVANIEKLEVTSTAKGDIRTVFTGGTWQGDRVPNPMSAQRISDRISIQLAGDGVALKDISIDPCEGERFNSEVNTNIVRSDLVTFENLKPYECKFGACFTVPESSKPIKRILIDFLENPRACVRAIRFQSTLDKAPDVIVRLQDQKKPAKEMPLNVR